MRKPVLVALVVGLVAGVAVAASGNVRYVVEDGATGAQTYGTAPHLVYGQDSTTLQAAVCETGVCNRPAPSGCSKEGLRLGGFDAIRVSIAALPIFTYSDGGTSPAGALLGTGHLRAYYYDPDEAERTGCDGGWVRNTGLDLAVESTSAGQLFPDLVPGATINGTRLVYAADSVGVDGGLQVDGGQVVTVKVLGICPLKEGCR